MFWRRLLFLLLLGGMFLSQPIADVSAATPCDWAQFITDVSVPDGSLVAPGAIFTKIWRIKNIGTCTWTGSYSLVFDSGSQMAGASPTNLPNSVAPGQTIDLPVVLAAPSVPGQYRGYWKLADAAGVPFGIGTTASGAFWVDIVVQDTATVAYDLVSFAPYAAWKSGAGALPFPGTSGDYRGYALRFDSLTMEDGAFTTAPSLLTVPQNKTDGYIQAAYPEFTVQKGDRFQTTVGCESGSSCYVTYRLDYVSSAGVTRTFWTRKEMNDGRAYQANVDLSLLAGQTVRFMLSVLATGSPEHDRAIWLAPRIVRTSGTLPVTPVPPPVLTPTPTPFESPPVINPSACDKASFVYDVTVPDGTTFSPGAAFSKTWRLKNSGSCTWKAGYHAVFYSGERMSAPTSVNLPMAVSPGQTVDLTINMVAPQELGEHRGNWVLSNAEGVLFGLGSPAVNPFWLKINVSGETALGSGYDFASNVCAAQWRNGSGALPCPGTDGDLAGFVIKQDAPQLEDGTIASLPGLLVAPQYKYNGYIQGVYPTFTVQAGDRFQAMVGCEYKAPCYANFRLDYMTAAGTVKTFWTWTEKNESRFYNANIDLSPLAGQSVRFILANSAAGYATGDRLIWGAPHIQRAVINLPSTPTPTITPTIPPPGDDWLTYSDARYAFQFKYPAQAQIVDQSDNYIKLDLPIVPGTNLHEKYLEVSTSEDLTACTATDTNYPGQTFETVSINGLSFLKEMGWEGGMNKLYEWVIYSTARDGVCVRFNFLMRSVNLGVFDTPPPAFDKAAESLVFLQMMNTFMWLTPPQTPSPTIAPPGDDWLTYSNARYGFQFKYPPQAQIADEMENYVKLNMPFAPGTNLMEKTLEVLVTENASSCQAPLQTNRPPETVTINGISFLRQTGLEGAAGNSYQWVAYSTASGAYCVSFTLLMHSLSSGAMQTPLPEFDLAAESVVIDQVVNTFAWTAPTETPTPTPSATLPPMEDWLTGHANHIVFKYPSQSQVVEQSDTHLKIELPFTPGTNLHEKYMEVQITENASLCANPLNGPPQSSETVIINNISFLKETGSDGAAGSFYEWVSYSSLRGGVCATMSFVLHSFNPGVYSTPPVLFDRSAESVVFGQIMDTFLWMIPSDWLTYTSGYGFRFQFPAAAQIVDQSDTYVKFELPFAPGTNLADKYLEVFTSENQDPCSSTVNGPGQTSETVVINGISFLKQTGVEGAMSKLYDWVAYSTARDSVCVSFTFLLRSINPGVYTTPPPLFDRAAESLVFDQIINTFAWLAAPQTPTPTPTPTIGQDTPTPTPTFTQLPPGGEWLTYTNSPYAFQFRYPAEGQITDQMDNYLKLMLPITPGTNLLDKFLQVYVAQNVDPCRSPLSVNMPPQITETVVINGVTFLTEKGMEGVTGQTYQWIAYSTARAGTCVTFNFVLHSRNPGNYPTPPVIFDEIAESAVFEQIMATFAWLGPTDTATPTPTTTEMPPDTPTPTPTPTGGPIDTPTPTPVSSQWITYTNPRYGFELLYPADGRILAQLDSYVQIALPFVPGTNLVEKNLQAYVAENVTPCRSPLGYMLPVQSSAFVEINGNSFLKETGILDVAGQFYEWIAYATGKGTACTSLNFILHSTNVSASQTPAPPFDSTVEKAVFEQIVATFHWTSATITPTPTPTGTPTSTATVQALPDLSITALRTELEYTACLLPDHPFVVRVGVVNNGSVPAPAFSVRLGELEQTVDALGAGETTSLSFKPAQYDMVSLTALVDPGALVLESDEGNNSRTELVWVPTAPIPCTPTPTTALLGPYGVVLMGQDVLTIRTDAGSANPVIGTFDPDAGEIMRTGPQKTADNAAWVEVVNPAGGTGWVDYSYLTEAVSHEAFCADARVPALITQLKQAVMVSDGSLFASLVSPKHGIRVNYWRYATPVLYSSGTAQNIFSDTIPINWGAGASGIPDIGSFAQVVQPNLVSVLSADYQLLCDDPSYARMFVDPWPYLNIHYYTVLKPPTPGVDLDWKLWLLGFEYVEGQPYLFGTVHYVWEP